MTLEFRPIAPEERPKEAEPRDLTWVLEVGGFLYYLTDAQAAQLQAQVQEHLPCA